MSSASAFSDAVSIVQIAQYYCFATFALVAYDWLINFDKEILCFWDFRNGRKPTVATLIYMLTRYPMIIAAIFELWSVFPMSDEACRVNFRIQVAAGIPVVLSPAVFSTIRVYALSNKNLTMTFLTLLLFFPGFISPIISDIATPVEQPSPFNCSATSMTPLPENIVLSLSTAGRITAIAADLLVLLVTWYNTYTVSRMHGGVLKGPSLVRAMLYNGSIYFIIITSLNILVEILISVLPPNDSPKNPGQYLLNPLTSVLTCHFLLNLRQADRSAATFSSPEAIASLDFGRLSGSRTLPAFIASMGEPVYTGLSFVDSIRGDEGADNGSERRSSEVSLQKGEENRRDGTGMEESVGNV